MWYMFKFIHGPGHQSTTTKYVRSDHALSDDDLSEKCHELSRERDLENWSCKPELIDHPPAKWMAYRIEHLKSVVKDAQAEIVALREEPGAGEAI